MINPKKQRFYWLMLQQDLFGSWCVRKLYGGLLNNHRREAWIAYNSEKDASAALTELEYLRRQHGYIYADVDDSRYFALRPQTFKEVLRS